MLFDLVEVMGEAPGTGFWGVRGVDRGKQSQERLLSRDDIPIDV